MPSTKLAFLGIIYMALNLKAYIKSLYEVNEEYPK